MLLLAGRILLQVDLSLPDNFELAAPIDEQAIWKHGRGSCVELSALAGILIQKKVAVTSLDEADFA